MANDVSVIPAGEVSPAPQERALPAAAMPRVTLQTIEETVQQLQLLQGLVRKVLVRGRDFGKLPTMDKDGLWDPGASLIISSFRCRPGRRRLLSLRDDEERISVIVEVPLVSFVTGQEMGSGIGAASTLETKYKYRWLSKDDALKSGFDEEDLAAFRSKEENGRVRYRVPNPEYSELLNTIVKIASKRAEVDAAETLPGVSSALRELFEGKLTFQESARAKAKPPAQAGEGEQDISLGRFWGETGRLGITEDKVHEILKVKSVNDWVREGRTLLEALVLLRNAVAQPPRAPQPPDEPTGERPPAEDLAGFQSWGEVASAVHDMGVDPKKVFARAGDLLKKRVERWTDMGADYLWAYSLAQQIAAGG